ncbi:SDR family oxidoreductase [Streptomyces sp. NBC_01334]|uniref:SDR family oxidoreductase n=1 Tax=Streptomyces sp. NBC_01334 TaxID=2903827 RepID=UPI002E122479|nr:SDR family oxidoreductase [Streptomyces sp. NBC_01334]
MAAHGTAEAALNTFARFVAHEAGPPGVNVVAPGYVRTEISARMPHEFQGRLADDPPLGRVAEPGRGSGDHDARRRGGRLRHRRGAHRRRWVRRARR